MASTLKKVSASLVYGLMGLVLYFINKIILTTYKFPYYCVMGLLQSVMITLIFRILKHFRLVRFPDLSFALARQLFPIPVFYTINLVTGLGATKFITAPMFVVLRRFSIPLTLFLQYRILGIQCSKHAIIAIIVLLSGSLIAMFEDFSFNLIGYLLCFVNDMGDSFESILTKKQLIINSRQLKSAHESEESLLESGQKARIAEKDTKIDTDELQPEIDIGKCGILYYSAYFNVIPLFILVVLNGDLEACLEFKEWMHPTFCLVFFSSSLLSVLFLYTWITCTDINSPLLSQIVSCLRSILTTYIGMYIGGDYVFNFYNFIGLNISMIGAFAYAYVNFTEENDSSCQTKVTSERTTPVKKKPELQE